jgi:hypothetical protein
MKNIGIVLVAVAALAGVGGCKKKNGMTDEMSKFKDRMCACADKKDAECGKKVTADMGKWVEQNPDKASDASAKPSEEDATLTRQLGECTTRAMMAGGTMGGSAAPSAGGGGDMGGGGSATAMSGGSAAPAGSAH